MYFGSQSVAEEQPGNEKKIWVAVRPIMNLQTFNFSSSTDCMFNTTATTRRNVWPNGNLCN